MQCGAGAVGNDERWRGCERQRARRCAPDGQSLSPPSARAAAPYLTSSQPISAAASTGASCAQARRDDEIGPAPRIPVSPCSVPEDSTASCSSSCARWRGQRSCPWAVRSRGPAFAPGAVASARCTAAAAATAARHSQRPAAERGSSPGQQTATRRFPSRSASAAARSRLLRASWRHPTMHTPAPSSAGRCSQRRAPGAGSLHPPAAAPGRATLRRARLPAPQPLANNPRPLTQTQTSPPPKLHNHPQLCGLHDRRRHRAVSGAGHDARRRARAAAGAVRPVC